MRRRAIETVVVFALAALLLPAQVRAQDPGAELALVQRLLLDEGAQGFHVFRAGADETHPGDMGDLLNHGDDAATLAGTRAAIRFTDDQSLVRMHENTELKVRAEGESRGALRRIIELEGGEIWARITGREGTETQVRTPGGVAAVRGTDLIVRFDRVTGETTVITLEGVVDFFNDVGEVEIPEGRLVTVATTQDVPEVRDVEDEDLEPSRELLEDQAREDARGMIEALIGGEGGRQLLIELGQEALELLGRSSRR